MKAKSTILFLLVLSFARISYGQTIVCENAPCTANDYTLDYFYLGDENGTQFGAGYCEPGETVNAHIWTNFVANSAAPRYSLFLHFNLYVDDVFIATIDECYYEYQGIPTNVELDLYNFNWECGSEITLKDFYMSWQPNINKPCGCNGSKCYKEASILVQAPLIANFEFNPSCAGEFALDFVSTTTGGTPPYTYLWDFGDGTTSTLVSPTHVFASIGPYTVTLTVNDQLDWDSHGIEIVSFDPYLPPQIYAPPNSNIEGCGVGDIPVLPLSTTSTSINEAQFNAYGGTLNVTGSLVSFEYIDTVSGTCPTTVTRTFTVLDSCDNTEIDVQLMVINDTTLPTASNPAPVNVKCISDVPAPDINIITDAADNCSAVVVTFVSDVSNNGTCPEIITRTYNITDSCGNSLDLTQIITINDDIAPTGSNPASLSVECIGDVPAPNISVITDAADNCSIPVVAFVSETSDGNTCPITITRNYSVTDDCNNSIILTRIITVNDTQAPTATNPASISVECSSAIPVPDISVITDAADNCSIPIVTFVSDVSNSGSCPEIITRTYSLIDDCGNETFVTQDITITDTTAPTASVPAPINVQCIADVPAPDITIISDATDNCSAPVVSFISDISTGTCPQLITRTYRIEDGCGNTIDIVQDINVNDNILPTASNPAPININCSDSLPIPDGAAVTDAADNCSVPTVEFVSDISNGMCPEIITRTYSVTDECGNSINVTQDIISNDVDAPTVDVAPVDVTADCDAIPPPSSLTFTDNCSAAVTVVFTQSDTNVANTIDYDIIRTWTVTDNCGNSDIFTQNIHVLIANCFVPVCASDCGAPSDTTPPTASILPDLNVPCESDIPAPDVNVVTGEMDNCSATVVVAFVGETINTGCFEKIVRTYSVTDKCGNVLYLTRRISVVDITPPTASNPASMDVSCTDNIPAPDVNVVTDEADNCSTPIVVAFVSDISNNASCNQRVTRTYSVTDGCGNTIYVTQDINVLDTVPPTADTPSDFNISCISDVPIPDTSIITNVADNCSTTTVSFISDISDNNICPETITRTYRVADDCGNIIDVFQNIIISDTIDPTASNPATLQFTCITDVPLPDVNVVTDEDDNCSITSVAFVSDVSDNLTCPETITRTYSVTDGCGNSINVAQTIIVNDDIDPTASNPITVQVSQTSQIPVPDVNDVTDEADNCAIPTVTYISDISDNLTCPETITRTYRVTDDCGNFIDVTQNILINDNVAPTASNPSSIAVQCIGDVPAVDINVVTDAADNDSTPTVTFVSETSDAASCPEIITRIYGVTDNCGNYIEVNQTIVVDDDIPPTASDPATIQLLQSDPVPVPDINVVIDEADNCTVNPLVAFVSEISNNDTCQVILTRTYSVTDDCGNSINLNQEIVITDDVNPTASNPAPMALSCEDIIPDPDINVVIDAADNFSATTVIFVDDVSDDQTCPETITRIYRIIDACGNFFDVTQDIVIGDSILPTASNPATIQIDCAANIPAPDIAVVTDAADNCSVPTVTFVSDVSDNLTCPETITRTYSVEDACGNIINVTQDILIIDDIPPTASDPATIQLLQSDPVPVPDINVVIDEADNCTVNPLVAFVSEISNNDTCQVILTRTYSVTDDCGNSINVNQEIIIIDNINPTASNPAPMALSCEDVIPVPDINVVIDAADNFSGTTVIFVDDVSDNQTCPETITRTYSVEDACGNTINVTQDIVIGDAILPTASNPAAIQIDCATNIPAPDIAVVTDAADSCSVPTVTFVSDVSDNLTCPETITRTYSVEDACGNIINVTQNIIIIDDIAPTLVSGPNAEITLTCEAFPEEDTIEFVDNCTSDVTVTLDEQIIDIDGLSYDIIRTWTALDDCDNESNFTQTIHMQSSVETFAHNIVICIEDTTVNLVDLIGEDEGGNWTGDFLYLLEGNTLNPSLVPLGSYDFIYTTTNNDCSRVNQITIEVNDDCVEYPCIKSSFDVNISKLVTPDGDSKNETFEVSYILNEEVDDQSTCDIITTVKMFSRWGNKVFESDEYYNDWNGASPSSAFGKADKLPAGTYYYVINLINSGLKPMQGYIYLGTDK